MSHEHSELRVKRQIALRKKSLEEWMSDSEMYKDGLFFIHGITYANPKNAVHNLAF